MKPVPVAVSPDVGSVPLGDDSVMLGSAVNDDVEVVPSAVNVSGVFGEFVTMIEQVSVPVASVLHAPSVNVTADGTVATIVGLASFAVKPVPVAVSVCGSVWLVGVNDQEGSTVNIADAWFPLPSVAVTVRAPVVPVSIVNAQFVKLPVAPV